MALITTCLNMGVQRYAPGVPQVIQKITTWGLTHQPPVFTAEDHMGFVILGVTLLFMMWVGFANQVKRFHDLGSSGWMVFWLFVPIVNIWFIIKLAFFKGEMKDNRYGMNPY
jgi:uncharacterized membrane protein YhaH (DUF805 family)